MTLFDFAWKNITRDTKTYLYYFINCVFSVFVFFLFSALAAHPALSGIPSQSALGFGLTVAKLIIILFALVFINYSVKNFLKARGKQFGTIIILGGTKKQINTLIFFENVIIGFCSIVSGILVGLVLFKGFLMAAEKLITGLDLSFYFPAQAIVTTVIAMGILFLVIAYIAPRLIRKEKVIHLIKAEETVESMPNIKLMSILLVVSVIGVIISICCNRYLDLFNVILLPLAALALISAVFLISYAAICFCISMFKKTNRYYHGTNMILLPDIFSKINTNLQVVTLATVLYAISFLAIIMMVSSNMHVKETVKAEDPYTFFYQSWSADADTEGNVAYIDQAFKDQPGYKNAKITFWTGEADGTYGEAILPVSMYNRIAEFLDYPQAQLKGSEAIAIAGMNNLQKKDIQISDKFTDLCGQQGYQLEQIDAHPELIATGGLFTGITVVSDEAFAAIENQMTGWDMYVFDTDNWISLKSISDEIGEHFAPARENGEATFVSACDAYQSQQMDAGIYLYIGSILCFSFLLGVTSFIYSRLYSGLEKDCEHFRCIAKIGLSKKELKAILNRYLDILMWTPFLFSMIIMWIGIFRIDMQTTVKIAGYGWIFTAAYFVLQFVLIWGVKKLYRGKIMGGVYPSDLS